MFRIIMPSLSRLPSTPYLYRYLSGNCGGGDDGDDDDLCSRRAASVSKVRPIALLVVLQCQCDDINMKIVLMHIGRLIIMRTCKVYVSRLLLGAGAQPLLACDTAQETRKYVLFCTVYRNTYRLGQAK